MAKFNDLANTLVERREVSVFTGDRKEHDNLRTRLCKYFSTHKKLLDSLGASDDSSTLSVSGEFDTSTGTSTFYIRAAKNLVGKVKDYLIIEAEDTDGEPVSG